MNASPTLMQIKYARVIRLFAEEAHLTLEEALNFFYHSQTYEFMRLGVSDMHSMSDGYLSDCLKDELAQQPVA